MKILIGSRALQQYDRLKGRNPDDWDIIHNGDVNRLGNVEYYDAMDGTNWDLYIYSINHFEKKIMTPYGEALVAPLEVLKVLKLCCVDHLDKAKHKWDLQNLKDVELNDELKSILIRREAEVKERVAKQKNSFFNKYDIPRWFVHDDLHTYINPEPAYLKVLEDAVNISQDKFLSLSLQEQIQIIREECFVLTLERELIPRVKKNPILVKKYVAQFSKCEKSSDWSYKWLSRMSIPEKLKDHPIWLANWCEINYNSIVNEFSEWWNASLDSLPKHFWIELLKVE